jgi:Saccharopine dehydrogenase NADP binding domain
MIHLATTWAKKVYVGNQQRNARGSAELSLSPQYSDMKRAISRSSFLLIVCMLSFKFIGIKSFSPRNSNRIIGTIRPSALFSMTSSSNSNSRPVSSLASPLEKHGKRLPKASMSSFLVTTAFIPVWAVTVLPLSVLYQAGSAAWRPIGKAISSKEEHSATQKLLDSGYVIDASVIIPRPERKYDIVVLGATGFTGYLAARHLAKTYGVDNKTIRWAIAGRSIDKLEKVKQDLAKELNMPEIESSLDTIFVDTSIASTLPKLVSQTRVVATTAGPYTLYGCSVVEFCAKFGTHYVDITGEVDWVKAMICQWQETAQKTGAKLIPFCGHGKQHTCMYCSLD